MRQKRSDAALDYINEYVPSQQNDIFFLNLKALQSVEKAKKSWIKLGRLGELAKLGGN